MKGLKRMKIKTKIWVLFLACILMSSVISIGTVVYSSQKSNLKHIGEMTTQTLHAIDSNLELMIDHVNQDTYAVFWSKMFQDTLEEVSKGNLTVKTRTELQDCLTNIMLAGDSWRKLRRKRTYHENQRGNGKSRIRQSSDRSDGQYPRLHGNR